MTTPSSDSPNDADGISLQNVAVQFALMCAVFWYWSSPVLQPLKVVVVLFHEMSHGLAALLTGGRVIDIIVTEAEGGSCETEGGWPLVIVSAGYLGGMLFGGTILYLSRFRQFVPLVCGLLITVMLCAAGTVIEDSYSRRYAFGLAGAFVVLGFFVPSIVGRLGLRAIGTFACLYSIFDIYWDVLAERNHGMASDATVFASLSGSDAETVGAAWLLTCVVFFFIVLRSSVRPTPDEAEVAAAPEAVAA